jgi:hypothetical protein
MANFNDIRDYAEERGIYSLLSRFFGTGDTMGKLFWTALSVVIGIFILIWGFNWLFNVGADETWEKLKLNDSVYINRIYFKDTTVDRAAIYRLVRPITASDVDTMKIESWKKLQMKNALDTTLKPQLIRYNRAFSVDSMYKNHSAAIGTYLGRDSILEVGWNHKWYILKPNSKVIFKVNPPDDIPEGYIIASKDCYFNASLTNLEQPTVFGKK